jgi:hypothetical protein
MTEQDATENRTGVSKEVAWVSEEVAWVKEEEVAERKRKRVDTHHLMLVTCDCEGKVTRHVSNAVDTLDPVLVATITKKVVAAQYEIDPKRRNSASWR